MDKFTVLLNVQGKFEPRGGFNTLEEAIKHLQEHWFKEWADGKAFLVERIPLKLEVGQ